MRLERGLPAFAVGAGLLLVAGPVLATVLRAFSSTNSLDSAPTLAHLLGVLTDPLFGIAALNSVFSALCVTLLSGTLATALAWIVVRTDLRYRRVFDALNVLPFFFSPYVGALSWMFLASPNSGILQHWLHPIFGDAVNTFDLFSLAGVIWVLALFYTPFFYLFVIGPMRSMDGALEEAARVHGAGFWLTTRAVTLPLMVPAFLSAGLIVFVTSAGLFDVPLALATPKNVHMVPTEIYLSVQYPTNYGRAAAISLLMMAVTIAIATLQHRYIGKRRFDTISGKGFRPQLIHLKPGGVASAVLFELGYLTLSVALPFAALIMVALSPLWTGTFHLAHASLSNFVFVLFRYDMTASALRNSLFLAAAGATIGVILGTLQANFLRDQTGSLGRWLGGILSMPVGIPGIIIGLGFLILLIRTPLYNTIWIILIAYVAHFFPYALRGVTAMLLSLNPELEQSARASGATWLQTMRLVVLPLLAPALAAMWLMLFVIFIRELGSTILLYGQGTETLSVAMVVLSERSLGYVAAIALVQAALLLCAFLAMRPSGISQMEC